MSPRISSPQLRLGDAAPDFRLKTEGGVSIHLADVLREQAVVLIFYPGDMTPGCTMQLCAIRDEWLKFQHNRIQVFGLNHAPPASHQAFRQKHTLPFPLLIDTAKEVSKAYGALWQVFGITIIRRTVVGIDQQGLIRFYKHGLPKNADILKAMKK